ncbi:TetR/AcrR family transcriptional regulator [Microbacterium suwonense]|uniref:TetR/AcrR family transcriptional regulator n=1 Tax=Microbacterium suwonense TaxID=683047 RepID=UPI00257235EB|nr:TetR/AcrR family transcriptional regulator [Microbacterium suwonense]
MAQITGAHRRALIEATVAEFAAAGYEGASLNRIIRAAGISKSSFYHAVGSKAELLDAVVESLIADVRARWTPLRRPTSRGWDSGRRWIGCSPISARSQSQTGHSASWAASSTCRPQEGWMPVQRCWRSSGSGWETS